MTFAAAESEGQSSSIPRRAWSFDVSAPSIEDMVKDIFKDVPDEEWDRLPPDLTDRLDHYLYGGNEKENDMTEATREMTDEMLAKEQEEKDEKAEGRTEEKAKDFEWGRYWVEKQVYSQEYFDRDSIEWEQVKYFLDNAGEVVSVDAKTK